MPMMRDLKVNILLPNELLAPSRQNIP